MRRINTVSILTVLFLILAAWAFSKYAENDGIFERSLKVGFVYNGDESTPYAYNFIRSQHALEAAYGDRIEILTRSNVPEETGGAAIRALAEEGCDLIFTTSFGYGDAAKELAREFPGTQFCQATCYNAGDDPIYLNYHTFMGEIHEGRFLSGVLAGMKLKELIEGGSITAEEAWVGYVGAFPYAEVISGYTAFFLGVRSIVPTARMRVRYTDTWSSYSAEKAAAEQLIDEGCVIISQHSDTIGPAVACEAADAGHPVYHVGYNQSMQETAPTTSIASVRINWTPYILGAVQAVLEGDKIERHVAGHQHGNDIGAGFDQDWIQVVDLNPYVAAEGSEERCRELIKGFRHHRIRVFQGDYIGVDPFDEENTYDLSRGFDECGTRSAPMWNYVLRDVITVED